MFARCNFLFGLASARGSSQLYTFGENNLERTEGEVNTAYELVYWTVPMCPSAMDFITSPNLYETVYTFPLQ